LLGHQRLSAGRIQLRQLERSLRIRQLAFRLIDVGLENDRIDLGDHLPRFHDRIKIREELLDIPRDLAANLDILHRIQCACRSDRLRNRAARNRHGLEVLARTAVTLAKREPNQDERHDGSDDWDGSFIHFGSLTTMIAPGAITTADALRSCGYL
jgi:hypothetical protein